VRAGAEAFSAAAGAGGERRLRPHGTRPAFASDAALLAAYEAIIAPEIANLSAWDAYERAGGRREGANAPSLPSPSWQARAAWLRVQALQRKLSA
jgi:hypothetical protein